ncbi:MAG: hypothetical protein WBP93_14965 [Pyrinomonadaceae bacterium]
MPVSVGEYLAQRTDVDRPQITPSSLSPRVIPTCPFMGQACSKIKKHQHPVCSMRDSNGNPWIVCTDRLIPARTNTLTPYHIAALSSVAETLFPNIYTGDVGYRRQISLRVGEGTRVVLDYVLDARGLYTGGRDRVILEVQGGGETSSTGAMTSHIANWSRQPRPTNAFLRQNLPRVGKIPNNAWKRQLEQIGRKYAVTQRFGGAFALVMGEVFYDYVRALFPLRSPYFPEWEIALLSLAESTSNQPGPIPIDTVNDAIFLTFDNFIDAAIRKYPLPEQIPDPFDGGFTTLSNDEYKFEGSERRSMDNL